MFLCFLVLDGHNLANKFVKPPATNHPVKQGQRVRIPLEKQVNKANIAYLNSLAAAPKKSLNSSFLMVSTTIFMKTGIGRAAISFALMPDRPDSSL